MCPVVVNAWNTTRSRCVFCVVRCPFCRAAAIQTPRQGHDREWVALVFGNRIEMPCMNCFVLCSGLLLTSIHSRFLRPSVSTTHRGRDTSSESPRKHGARIGRSSTPSAAAATTVHSSPCVTRATEHLTATGPELYGSEIITKRSCQSGI